MEFRDYQNVHQIIKETIEKHPESPAFRWFTDGEKLQTINWKEFYEQLRSCAKSLIALGVQHGDKVNILSYTCYKWVLTDMAVMSIGAVTVGIYQTLLPKDCAYIINHSDAVLVFVENHEQLNKILAVREKLGNIRKVILFEGAPPDDDWVLSFDEFMQLGANIPDSDFEQRVQQVTPQDVAGIVYTSGTTGVPKGAMLTHDNITFTTQSVHACMDAIEGEETFLFLPLAHVYARLCVYVSVKEGAALTFARSMDTLATDIKLARPHWFASVPRVYEKIYAAVIGKAEAKGGLALKIFRWATNVGNTVSDYKLEQKPLPFSLKLKYQLATRLVFQKIQEALGGRVRWCISGAAPLSPQIAKFFHAAGILILEGIGMTENTSFTNVNRVDNYRFGWVGQPGPGIEQKVGEDGELMYRGRNVMKAYYKMPEETAATITEDGWLKTGDLGEIDEEGFVRITGRKKDLIITAGGKNIAPAAIEGVLGTSKYINQVCVIGDRRKYLTALVTLDEQNVSDYAHEQGIEFDSFEELMKHPAIVQLINNVVEEKNKELASFESIKKVTIVPEFTIENDMLTPTLKLKKNVIMKKYEKEIDAMYPSD